MTLPTLDEVNAELCRRSLGEFVRQSWDVLEPATPFIDGWHIDAICEHLEAIRRRQIRKLIINIPPGLTKSRIVSVDFPAWVWTTEPSAKFLTASYAQTLATRDALYSRRLITSDWYQRHFASSFKLTGDQNQKMRYENDKTGFRIATSVGGVVTGERGDFRLLDDPLKAEDANSEAAISSTNDWLRFSWSTRDNDSRSSCEVVIMQRLHEKDPTGFMLAEFGGYEHLMIPMRYEAKRKCVTVIGWSDPRTQEGELLCPARFDETAVALLERKLGPFGASGQLQQSPSPAKGGLYKRDKWKFYQKLPDHFDEVVQSWDMTFKGEIKNDYVAGGTWGRAGANVYKFPKAFHERADIVATIAGVKDMKTAYPITGAIYIENKANGPAVVALLKNDIPGLIEVDPNEIGGDKASRAHATVPFHEAGNIWLPDPQYFPEAAEWVTAFIDEHARFTGQPGNVDDWVDEQTMAVIKLLAGPSIIFTTTIL